METWASVLMVIAPVQLQDCHELVASALSKDGAKSLEDALPGVSPRATSHFTFLHHNSFACLLRQLSVEETGRPAHELLPLN